LTPRDFRGRVGAPLALAIILSFVASCGKQNTPTGPTAVTTSQTTPGPATGNNPGNVAITGTVSATTGAPIAAARVEITSGNQANQAATTDASGQYTLPNLRPGAISLRISAFAYVTQTKDLTCDGNQVANVSLAPMPFQTQGFAFDLDSNSGVAGVTMTGDSISSSTSSAAGMFIALAANDAGAPRPVLLAGPGIVERHTYARVPGPGLQVGLVPSSFDLAAFDQMLRTPSLSRWTTSPPLMVLRSTLHFTSADAVTATAEGDVMTDQELASLESDLQGALGPMTGGTYKAFSGITPQTANAGDSVNLLNTGWITVVRMEGLTAATGFWGFGRYEIQGDGTVTGGIVMLDRDFERSGNPGLRTLRTHELGHALGYSHVTTRQSVMSPDARTDPTPWDLTAFRIAFARMPGNRSPDIDPSMNSANAAAAASPRWSKAIK